MKGKRRPTTSFSLGALATSAAQVLAPNSLQFNEHEFQRSPKEAQDAAREAAKLVKPGTCSCGRCGIVTARWVLRLIDAGDLIFITTSGLVYSVGRYLTENAYDHVVLRVPMSEGELQLFLRCAKQLIGCKYDVARAYQLMLRLALKRVTGSTPLPRLPLDVKSNAWICSDSIMYVSAVYPTTMMQLLQIWTERMSCTHGMDSVLLAGCCKGFREALVKARQETDLGSFVLSAARNRFLANFALLRYLAIDIFTLGSASMTDFERIRRIEPSIISRVPLPVVNYTLAPRKRSWRAYVPEVVRFAQSMQAGTLKWPLLAPEIFPTVHEFAASIPPTSWPVKRKIQVLGYVIVFLLMLRRGLTVKRVLLRAVEVLMLRYVAHHVMLHLQSSPAFGTARL
ncbi:hypothetical protein AM587_10007906 [Phytophthora nicotianae]|uniref:Uncharacterized protein n=1 Tax=Phytophthora nicotianae TaxID=4792 RepID=A0A0W8DDZ5_PHYNI|nr:hypothetical protein AM587_10007906 [Phytophthora nicotianae]